MKKLISMILILCMACMLIPAMAEDSILGDWHLSEIVSKGITANPADMGMTVTYSFKEDGTLEVTTEMMGQSTTDSATWAQDGNTVTVTFEDKTQVVTYADGKLTIEDEDQVGTLTREAPIASEKVKAVAAESEEAFFGDWTLSAMDTMGVRVEKAQFEAAGMAGYDATLKIEAGKVYSVTLFGETMGEQSAEYPSRFEDGKLLLTVELSEEEAAMLQAFGMTIPDTYTIEMMEDGSILFSMEMMGMQMGLYLVRSDAAAEQPAA